MGMLSTSKSWIRVTLTLMWQCQVALWMRKNPQEFHASCFNFTRIFSTSKSQTRLVLTFVWLIFFTFQTRSWSYGSRWQHLMNLITPLSLSASCCSFTGNTVFYIKISANFYVDLCGTFLNFQCSRKSDVLVNMIIPQELHASGYILNIKFWGEFDIDFCATLLN